MSGPSIEGATKTQSCSSGPSSMPPELVNVHVVRVQVNLLGNLDKIWVVRVHVIFQNEDLIYLATSALHLWTE